MEALNQVNCIGGNAWCFPARKNGHNLIAETVALHAPDRQLSAPDRLRMRIFFAPPAMFLYLLPGRGLILDGWPGWYYVMQRTIAEMLLSLRLLTERERLEEN